MNKKLIVTTLVLTILGGAIYGATKVSAQPEDNPHTTLIDRLVERFGLNRGEVVSVFEEVRGEHHVEMQAKLEDRLQEKVDDGTITAEQKQLILDKHAEMQTSMESYQNMMPEDRHEAMQTKHEELKAWAEENGIDLEDLMIRFGHVRGGMHGFMKDN